MWRFFSFLELLELLELHSWRSCVSIPEDEARGDFDVSFRWKPSCSIPEDFALLQPDFKTDCNGKHQPQKGTSVCRGEYQQRGCKGKQKQAYRRVSFPLSQAYLPERGIADPADRHRHRTTGTFHPDKIVRPCQQYASFMRILEHPEQMITTKKLSSWRGAIWWYHPFHSLWCRWGGVCECVRNICGRTHRAISGFCSRKTFMRVSSLGMIMSLVFLRMEMSEPILRVQKYQIFQNPIILSSKIFQNPNIWKWKNCKFTVKAVLHFKV